MSGFTPQAGPGRLTRRQRYDRVHRQVRKCRRRVVAYYAKFEAYGNSHTRVYGDQYEREEVEDLVAALVGHSEPRVWLWVMCGSPRVSIRWFYRERRWHDRLP